MTDRKLNYNRHLKNFSRQLRNEGTKGEAILWKKVLRLKQMEGYQFNRQYPIGNYIVDFVCRKLKLIIEIDGSSHLTKGKEDKIRQTFLEKDGFTVLRIKEMDVTHRIDDVIGDIHHAILTLQEQIKVGFPQE
jgi:very-short-patch-repair endonuclease